MHQRLVGEKDAHSAEQIIGYIAGTLEGEARRELLEIVTKDPDAAAQLVRQFVRRASVVQQGDIAALEQVLRAEREELEARMNGVV